MRYTFIKGCRQAESENMEKIYEYWLKECWCSYINIKVDFESRSINREEKGYFLRGFSVDSDGKESVCNVGDPGSIPGSGRSPGEGHGNPFQYSCLENSMDRETWQAIVLGVAKSDMIERLPFHFSLSCIGEGNGNPFQYSCLENPRDGGAW